MLQLARQTASQDNSGNSLVASSVSLSRQSTVPPSYRSRQNTIEGSPSHSSSLAVTPRPSVPPRRPVPRADTGANYHSEPRGKRVTEIDQRPARREIPRRRPVPPPATGAINPVLVRELLSAGRNDEETLVGSKLRSPPPSPLTNPRPSEHAPVQSHSASRRTPGPTQQSQQTPQQDREPHPRQTRSREKPKRLPAEQSSKSEQSTRPAQQAAARDSNMSQYATSGGGGVSAASKVFQQSQGGNYDSRGRAPVQAGGQAPPPDYTQSSQGPRGGQRFSNTNARILQGGQMLSSRLNQWDEIAQDTCPYNAALLMTIIFATIWGTGLITFGLVYYHKFRRLPYEDLSFKNEQGFRVNTDLGGKKERLFIVVVMLAGAFVIKVIYILSILQVISKYKGWGLYKWAKKTQQAYHKRRDARHTEKARQRRLDAQRHKDEIGRGQDGWEGPSQHQMGQMPPQHYR